MIMYAYVTHMGYCCSVVTDRSLVPSDSLVTLNIPTNLIEKLTFHANFEDGFQWFVSLMDYII